MPSQHRAEAIIAATLHRFIDSPYTRDNLAKGIVDALDAAAAASPRPFLREDIAQVNPTVPVWGGAFLHVIEILDGGVIGIVQVLGQMPAHIAMANDQLTHTGGSAPLSQEALDGLR